MYQLKRKPSVKRLQSQIKVIRRTIMLDIILNQIRVMCYTHSKELQLRGHKVYCLLDETVEVDLDDPENLETVIDKIKRYYDDKLESVQGRYSEATHVGYLFPLLQFRRLLIEQLVDIAPAKHAKYALDLN